MKLKKMRNGQLKPHIYFSLGRWHVVGLMINPTRAPNYKFYKRAGWHAKKLNTQLKQHRSPQEAV